MVVYKKYGRSTTTYQIEETMYYKLSSKSQGNMTASPDKYPQKTFREKQCRRCGVTFDPLAPSHLYCSKECADWGIASRYLRRNYGIDLDDYERMLMEQDGKCKICKEGGFKLHPSTKALLVVDHCHDTGKVRGLLCHNCNRGLGLFQDNKDLIKNAYEYLSDQKETG